MTTKLRTVLIARLMREDKHGLAYCLDHMKGRSSMCGIFVDSYTKKELREKLVDLTEEELTNLKTFRTYAPFFCETPLQVQISSDSGKIYSLSVENFIVGNGNNLYMVKEDPSLTLGKRKHRITYIFYNETTLHL